MNLCLTYRNLLVNCNWEQVVKCVLFAPIYSVSVLSGEGWALCIFITLLDLHCPQPVQLSHESKQWDAPTPYQWREVWAGSCQLCYLGAHTVISSKQMHFPEQPLLLQHMWMPVFMHDFFTLWMMWCLCFPRGAKHSLKVTQGSHSREILNPRAVTQAWEHLVRVVCNIPAHCAHYAHTMMLFFWCWYLSCDFQIVSGQQLKSKNFCLIRQ